jgi:hypothetical protein
VQEELTLGAIPLKKVDVANAFGDGRVSRLPSITSDAAATVDYTLELREDEGE